MKQCWGTCRAGRMYMWRCLTWSSSETLNRRHAAVGPLGQLGRAHLAGGSRLSGLHHRWLWEGGVQGTNRHREALTWTLGKSCALHSDLNTWKRQIRSEWVMGLRLRVRERQMQSQMFGGQMCSQTSWLHSDSLTSLCDTYLPWAFKIWLLTGLQRYELTFGPTADAFTLQQYLL